jgi:hypothetical protein
MRHPVRRLGPYLVEVEVDQRKLFNKSCALV